MKNKNFKEYEEAFKKAFKSESQEKVKDKLGSSKDANKIKKVYGERLIDKTAEIKYVRRQMKALVVKIATILSAYNDPTSRNVLKEYRDFKYCPCCGKVIKDEKK